MARRCFILLLSVIASMQMQTKAFSTGRTFHSAAPSIPVDGRYHSSRHFHAMPRSQTRRTALIDPSTDLSSGILSLNNIHSAFSVATFVPQPFWVLLTLIPNSTITKKIMGGLEIVTMCTLVHFFIVVASIVQPGGSAPLAEFSGVFDPAGDPQKAFIGMMQYPNFVTEEWSHVLTWDLFVGRWIWLDGLKRNIFTSHSVLLCNLIGPPGLLLHWATCLVTGKGVVPNEVPEKN